MATTQPRQVGSDGRFVDLSVKIHDPAPGSCAPAWLIAALRSMGLTVSVPKETGDAQMKASDAANNLSVIDGDGGIYTPAALVWSGTQTVVMGAGDSTQLAQFSGFGGTGIDPTNDSTVCVVNVMDTPGGHLANWHYVASPGLVTVKLFRVANDIPVGPFDVVTIVVTLKLFNFPAPNVVIP